MPDYYVGLHRHSSYSALDGACLPEQMAKRLVEIDQPACGLTDHGVTFGWAPFYKELEKRGLKPILGLEGYLVEDIARKGKAEADKKKLAKASAAIAHVTLLAKNQDGYRNILRLQSISYEQGFYRKPCLDFEQVVRHQEGVILLSGCVIGMLSKLINEGKEDAAYAWAAWLKERVENFWIEITVCPGLDISHAACPVLWRIAEDLSLPTVITDDSHFAHPSDYEAETAMLAIQTHDLMSNPKRALQLPAYHYMCTGDEVMDRARKVLPLVPEGDLFAAAKRSWDIASQCQVELPHCKGPQFQVPSGFTPKSYLRQWVEEGKDYRRELGLLPAVDTQEWRKYEEREAYEFEIVEKQNFVEYFLLVADIIRWAKSRNILCIARGSCGGSLLCFYLGVTQVDPVKLRLPVERFIDLSRPDPPDIDLDFDARYRDDCFRYLEQKYGKDHCAQIAALSTFRAKQSLKDVGKVYEIPEFVIAEVVALLPEVEHDGGIKEHGELERLFQQNEKAQQLLKEYPALQVAAQIEGQIRQQTIHAAGFIVDREPLAETVGVIAQPGKARVVACDMAYAPQLGLLKIDALSVEMLSAIAETVAAVKKDFDWLFRLPLDDSQTYAMLGQGRNQGVFQIKGAAAGKLLTELQPTEFNDLVALAALARPGPIQSGGAKEFVDRKHGRELMPCFHTQVAEIVGSTFGIVLYQEQVMEAMGNIGAMDLPLVHKIRKLVSKSGGPQAMEEYKPLYLEGARKNHIPLAEAEHVWIQCQRAGNYSFNKAHGAAYALVGYWSAFLKCHYPDQFSVAVVNHEKKEMYRCQLLREYKQYGGHLSLVDPNTSRATFSSPQPGVIVGGFANLRGVGEVIAKKLVDGQPYRDWLHFLKNCPVGVAKALQAAGAHTGKIDLDVALTIAPWYILVEYNDLEKAVARQRNAETVAGLLQRMETGERCPSVNLVGRVTGAETSFPKHRKPGEETLERLNLTLTDETGSVDIWYSGKKWRDLKSAFNPLRGATAGLGNSVYVRATISDDRSRLWGDLLYCFRESGVKAGGKRKDEQPKLEF